MAADARAGPRPQDPFERWAALQGWSNDATNRVEEAVDLSFWERVAASYDEGALALRVPAILDRVRALVPLGASVLDVGAGTGAFALPLARGASTVTALDYSPAMLHVLRAKRDALGVRNVEVLQARWEDALVTPHDVVLAANALYRAPNLYRALDKMVRLAHGAALWCGALAARDRRPLTISLAQTTSTCSTDCSRSTYSRTSRS